MNHNQDDDRSDEGIRVDFPFFAIRIGRGAMGGGRAYAVDDEYEAARRRVRARLTFYRHVATYTAVLAALVFLDLITGGGVSGWVLWPAGIVGALLILEAFNVFVFPSVLSREVEEKMIQDEIRRTREP